MSYHNSSIHLTGIKSAIGPYGNIQAFPRVEENPVASSLLEDLAGRR